MWEVLKSAHFPFSSLWHHQPWLPSLSNRMCGRYPRPSVSKRGELRIVEGRKMEDSEKHGLSQAVFVHS